MKKETNIVKAIEQIAVKNPSGFTVDKNLSPIIKGYAVATKLTQNSFGTQGAANAVAIAFYQSLEKFDGVGGWFNADNGQYYYDAVRIFRTKKQAEKYAQEQDQLAYFHLTSGKEYKTPPITITGGIPNSTGFSSTDGIIVR